MATFRIALVKQEPPGSTTRRWPLRRSAAAKVELVISGGCGEMAGLALARIREWLPCLPVLLGGYSYVPSGRELGLSCHAQPVQTGRTEPNGVADCRGAEAALVRVSCTTSETC